MNIPSSPSKSRMVGRMGVFACGCCHSDTAKRERRTAKRRERQAWKKAVRIS